MHILVTLSINSKEQRIAAYCSKQVMVCCLWNPKERFSRLFQWSMAVIGSVQCLCVKRSLPPVTRVLWLAVVAVRVGTMPASRSSTAATDAELKSSPRESGEDSEDESEILEESPCGRWLKRRETVSDIPTDRCIYPSPPTSCLFSPSPCNFLPSLVTLAGIGAIPMPNRPQPSIHPSILLPEIIGSDRSAQPGQATHSLTIHSSRPVPY